MATPAPSRSLNDASLAVGSDGSLLFSGDRGTLSPIVNAPPGLVWNNAPARSDHEWSRYFVFEDDFMQQGSASTDVGTTWTDMNNAAATNAFQNVPGGVYNIVTGAVLDNYHGMRTAAQNWQFVANKEHWLEARFKVTEAAVNASSWLVGLMDTFTTGGLQTGALGPLANFSGAVFSKVQGGMGVKLTSSNGATQTVGTNIATAVSGNWTRVGFYFDAGLSSSATAGNIFPYIDIGDGNGWKAGTSQSVTLAGLNAMSMVITAKAGGANAETLQLDYVKLYATR